jgi:CBS domain-containing protein
METAMKVAEVMKEIVITTRPDAAIAEAAQLMLDNRISGLPVFDNQTGALVGMLTEGDLLRRVETGTQRRRPRWLELLIPPGRMAMDYVATHGRKVAEVMTPDVTFVGPDADLFDVVRLMERRRIKRVPVMKDGILVGIVTRADLVRALLQVLPKPGRGARPSDDDIRQRILAELDQQKWAPRLSVTVVVKDGVVELSGCIPDERERPALQVLAENVAGVVAVHDHLTCVDPISAVIVPPGVLGPGRP